MSPFRYMCFSGEICNDLYRVNVIITFILLLLCHMHTEYLSLGLKYKLRLSDYTSHKILTITENIKHITFFWILFHMSGFAWLISLIHTHMKSSARFSPCCMGKWSWRCTQAQHQQTVLPLPRYDECSPRGPQGWSPGSYWGPAWCYLHPECSKGCHDTPDTPPEPCWPSSSPHQTDLRIQNKQVIWYLLKSLDAAMMETCCLFSKITEEGLIEYQKATPCILEILL